MSFCASRMEPRISARTHDHLSKSPQLEGIRRRSENRGEAQHRGVEARNEGAATDTQKPPTLFRCKAGRVADGIHRNLHASLALASSLCALQVASCVCAPVAPGVADDIQPGGA